MAHPMRHAAGTALVAIASLALASAIDPQCQARLDWFEELDGQAENPKFPGFSLEDPKFPANMQSISPSEKAKCGDTAAGISDPCTNYDSWETFQDVAKKRGKRFSVIGPEGIKFSDINQGALGDCYFLSALASLAHAVPSYIDGMFINRHLWPKDVYSTTWILNGQDITVAVNNDIPFNKKVWSTWFAQPASHGDTMVFWPLILEKAWSKIFKSFKAVEGGIWMNVVAALTSATVKTVKHKNKEQVWKTLLMGTRNSYPMGAGTGPNAPKYGMVTRHAYAVLKARETSDGKRVVTCYNPWGSDLYKGVLPNPDKSDGKFDMTLDEYLDAFRETQVAEIVKHYRTSTSFVRSAKRKELIYGVKEFTIKSSEPFFVSVTWPADHLMEPCKVKDPNVLMAVAKKDDFGKVVLGQNDGRHFGVNSDSAEVTLGPGTYVVYVGVQPKGDFIQRVSVTVYSPETVQFIKSSLDPKDVAKAMLEPKCDTMTMTGNNPHFKGLFERNPSVRHLGVATYLAHDKGTVAYYKPNCGGWTFIGKHQWRQAAAGANFRTHCYKVPELGKCGKHDVSIIGGFNVGCHVVAERRYNNLACTGKKASLTVQRFCPATCRKILEQEKAVAANPSSISPPCDVITITGKGRFNDGLFKRDPSEKVNDVPPYKSTDGKTVWYYKPHCQGWTHIGISQWAHVKAGANFRTPCFKADKLGKCGCKDAPVIGPFGIPCTHVEKYSNLGCHHGVHQKMIRRFCAATCGDHVCPAPARLYDASTEITTRVGQVGASAAGTVGRSTSVLLVACSLLVVTVAALAVVVQRRRRRGGHCTEAGNLILAEGPCVE